MAPLDTVRYNPKPQSAGGGPVSAGPVWVIARYPPALSTVGLFHWRGRSCLSGTQRQGLDRKPHCGKHAATRQGLAGLAVLHGKAGDPHLSEVGMCRGGYPIQA